LAINPRGWQMHTKKYTQAQVSDSKLEAVLAASQELYNQ